jgi:hypothetical protein
VAIVSSVLLWFMPSDYPFGIFWPLYRLSYFDLCLLITPLVSFGHCIVCPTLIYAFWLPLWYLLAIVSSVLLWFMPPRTDDTMAKKYQMGNQKAYIEVRQTIQWPTKRYQKGNLITFCYMLAIVSSVLLRFMPSDYPFGIFWPLYRLSYFS